MVASGVERTTFVSGCVDDLTQTFELI
jgi:hypothetical protein